MMALLGGLLASAVTDLYVLSTIFVGLVTLFVARFYYTVKRYPSGPFPLPILGNVLALRGSDFLYNRAIKWAKIYGDPFTIWIGHRPFVIVNELENFKEISGKKRNEFAGRIQAKLTDVQTRGFVDVVFADFTHAWDALRRVAHVAIRKYAGTEKLAQVCKNFVDETVQELPDEKKQEVQIVDLIEDIVNNVIAISAFGEAFQRGSEDYNEMRTVMKEFEKDFPNGFPSDILPILGLIFYSKEQKGVQYFARIFKITDKMYANAKQGYTPGVTRHFVDSLLSARDQALKEEKSSAQYLVDENLRQTVFDIFGAGINTSKTVVSFCLLRLADQPEIQDKLREEIKSVLGEDAPVITDRDRLRLVSSFIQEVIRVHPPVPLNVPRKTMCDVELGGRNIPKDTGVLINLLAMNKNCDIWGSDAGTFKADRFLQTEKEQMLLGFTSFGTGTRSCPGEKMAMADVFYVLVRLLQKLKFECPGGPGTADLGSIPSDIQIDAIRQKLLVTKLS